MRTQSGAPSSTPGLESEPGRDPGLAANECAAYAAVGFDCSALRMMTGLAEWTRQRPGEQGVEGQQHRGRQSGANMEGTAAACEAVLKTVVG